MQFGLELEHGWNVEARMDEARDRVRSALLLIPGSLERGRQFGNSTHGDREVAGVSVDNVTGRFVADANLVQAQRVGFLGAGGTHSDSVLLCVRGSRGESEGLDGDDVLAIRDGLVHASSGPSKVGGPFATAGHTLLLVDVACQTAVRVEIIVETVRGSWIAESDKVLERRNLELRAGQKEGRVPCKVATFLEKVGLEVGLVGLARFSKGNREGEMGRAEADT